MQNERREVELNLPRRTRQAGTRTPPQRQARIALTEQAGRTQPVADGSRRPRGQQSCRGDDGGSGGGPAAREAAAPGEAGSHRAQPCCGAGLEVAEGSRSPRRLTRAGQYSPGEETRRHSRRLRARAPPHSTGAGPRPSFYGERPPLAARRRALARATPPRAARHRRLAPRLANARCRGASPQPPPALQRLQRGWAAVRLLEVTSRPGERNYPC